MLLRILEISGAEYDGSVLNFPERVLYAWFIIRFTVACIVSVEGPATLRAEGVSAVALPAAYPSLRATAIF